jgi:thermitase
MPQVGATGHPRRRRRFWRRSRSLATPFMAILLLLQLALPAAANEPDVVVFESDLPYATDRVIVKWRDAGKAPALAQARGLTLAHELGAAGNGAPSVVRTEGRPVAQVLEELRGDAEVLYAEPDYLIQLAEVAAVTVNDPKTAGQYSLDRMRVRHAWSVETGDSQKVAVLDTGVQYSHPDLSGRLLPGYDFVNDDSDASDDNGHGTWVAGIIAANTNDSYGIAGITWSNPILPVKIMNANGTGYTSYLVDGLYWAANQGAKVINMSIGGFPASTSVQEAVDYAWNKGAVLVGAAGNNGSYQSHYPASFNHVISVSATQMDDELTKWSNYGPRVDVSAPGGSVLTTNCHNSRTSSCRYWGEHITISGTSFASPNTAGVVALIRAKNPSWTPQQVVDRLISTVDDRGYAGWDPRYGHGRVNAYRALGGSIASSTIFAGDWYEGNNAAGSARALALGTTVFPTIYPAGDVDFFTMRAPRAGRLTVRVTAVTDTVRPAQSSLPVDPVVELLHTNGTRLALVDNPSDSTATETASITVSAAQTIVIRVSNWFPNGTTATYTVRAEYLDTVGPKVAVRLPAPGATDVNRFTAPTITFDEAVTGVSASTVTLRDTETNALVPVAVTYDSGTRQARLSLSEPLAAERTYRLGVSSAVKDIAGNPFAGASWTFTTGLYGFYDIAGSPFEADIEWLAIAGITSGCGADRFCPKDSVSREQMASFLARAQALPAADRDYFTDDANSIHQGDINRLAASRVTAGCADRLFCPTKSVTREQMASFLARALGLPAADRDYFADDAGSMHEADINRLAAAGISAGCGPGTYCPQADVTREQMAAFLRRAFED